MAHSSKAELISAKPDSQRKSPMAKTNPLFRCHPKPQPPALKFHLSLTTGVLTLGRLLFLCGSDTLVRHLGLCRDLKTELPMQIGRTRPNTKGRSAAQERPTPMNGESTAPASLPAK